MSNGQNNSVDDAIDRHVIRKYEIVERVGKGAYGIVWKAINRKTGEPVALKKIFQAFQNDTDAQRTFRESLLLQEIQHPNIIRLYNVLRADSDIDLYLVFEFMETDLYHAVKSNILGDIHKQYIMYQLLSAIKYLHSGEIIHRDLKPSNLLLNSECHLKVGDFGLARSVAEINKSDDSSLLTSYVATRWYRAPELLLASTHYTKAVDMWAVGCILGELLGGTPMFPGSSVMNQLDKIIEITGRPTAEDIESIDSPYASTMLESLPLTCRPKPLSELYPTAPPEALDLLKKLLQFNPKKRITAAEAIKHPYFSQFHDESQEPICETPIRIMIDDNDRRTAAEYREMLYAEIMRRKREMKNRIKSREVEDM